MVPTLILENPKLIKGKNGSLIWGHLGKFYGRKREKKIWWAILCGIWRFGGLNHK